MNKLESIETLSDAANRATSFLLIFTTWFVIIRLTFS